MGRSLLVKKTDSARPSADDILVAASDPPKTLMLMDLVLKQKFVQRLSAVSLRIDKLPPLIEDPDELFLEMNTTNRSEAFRLFAEKHSGEVDSEFPEYEAFQQGVVYMDGKLRIRKVSSKKVGQSSIGSRVTGKSTSHQTTSRRTGSRR